MLRSGRLLCLEGKADLLIDWTWSVRESEGSGVTPKFLA